MRLLVTCVIDFRTICSRLLTVDSQKELVSLETVVVIYNHEITNSLSKLTKDSNDSRHRVKISYIIARKEDIKKDMKMEEEVKINE